MESLHDNVNRKVLALEQLAASVQLAIIEMLAHPENTGPDSNAQKCVESLIDRLKLIDECIVDIKSLCWNHIYQGTPQ